MPDSLAMVEGMLLAAWLLLTVASGLVALLWLLHRILDRWRMADWDEDWARFRLGRGRGVSG